MAISQPTSTYHKPTSRKDPSPNQQDQHGCCHPWRNASTQASATIASCRTSVATCQASLVTCQASLASCQACASVATCQVSASVATCQAGVSVRLAKTHQFPWRPSGSVSSGRRGQSIASCRGKGQRPSIIHIVQLSYFSRVDRRRTGEGKSPQRSLL